MDLPRLPDFSAALPAPLPAPRCWCCGALLTTRGECPVCDMAGLVSPPHVCARGHRVIGDEHGCAVEIAPPADFHARGEDHETQLLRRRNAA